MEYVTWRDLIDIATLILAAIGVFVTIKKDNRPATNFAVIFS